MRLILASASPRRAQILRDAGLRFEIASASVTERRNSGEGARGMTRRLALAKARTAAEAMPKRPFEAIVSGAEC